MYSSVSAGIHALDNADNLSPGSYEMPDQVWYAWYNGRATADIDPQWVRGGSWVGQRIHQYEAHVPALYGGYGLLMWAWFVAVGIVLIRLGREGRRAPAARV